MHAHSLTGEPPVSPDATEGRTSVTPLESHSLLALIELVLKDPHALNALIRRTAVQPALVPKFLVISLASFTLFGVALAIVIAASGLTADLHEMADVIRDGGPLISFDPTGTPSPLRHLADAAALIAAYGFGLIAATGVCLPSLYFYGLLSGIKLTMLDVVVHALKAKATTAVALVGILPIYVALAMGVLIFDIFPQPILRYTLWLGFLLPFIAGLWGTVSLYRGFSTLTDTLPPDRCERRSCFLRRLVFAWSACYTAVSPVMIFTVWQSLQSMMT